METGDSQGAVLASTPSNSPPAQGAMGSVPDNKSLTPSRAKYSPKSFDRRISLSTALRAAWSSSTRSSNSFRSFLVLGGLVLARRPADDQDELTLGNGAAFVKTRLKYLPQENDTWEADFEMLPKVMTMQTVSQYIGMVVTQPEGFPLALEEVEHMPNVDDLATLLAHAMNRPLIEGAHRPRQIVLRKNSRWQPLFRHLQEIGIEVAVQDDLPKIADEYSDYLRQMNKVRPSEQQDTVEKAFPAIAKWVQGYGHIEIGDQDGLGFVVGAFDDSGLVLEDDTAETLAEALAALEKGLEDWFGKQGIEFERRR